MASFKDDAPTDDEDESTTPVTKKLKSQAPDIIVSVGSGESKQDFKCYKVILCFACNYFEDMFSSGMKEGATGKVRFPKGDPEGWTLFYEFISPYNVLGKMKHDHARKITVENVMKLLPWFHQFEMKEHVQACEKCLKIYWQGWTQRSGKSGPKFWQQRMQPKENEGKYHTRLKERKALFDEAIGAMELAILYNLKSTKDTIGQGMALLMEKHLHGTDDLFDMKVIKIFLEDMESLKFERRMLRNIMMVQYSGGKERGCRDLRGLDVTLSYKKENE